MNNTYEFLCCFKLSRKSRSFAPFMLLMLEEIKSEFKEVQQKQDNETERKIKTKREKKEENNKCVDPLSLS